MNTFRSRLVGELRDEGHAVVDELGISACECGELVDRAFHFVDAALTLAGCPSSGHAYVRLSCSRGLLFVAVTLLRADTFDTVMNDNAAMTALEELRAWASGSDRSLTIDRGPRDQFRITVVFGLGERALRCDPGATELAAS
jgi:hypothetical protein